MPYPTALHQQQAHACIGVQGLRGIFSRPKTFLNVSVGTDPTLAMATRRGTGFYKVPSLRGVWYRNALGHGGQAETLEEWLDPARLKEDYVPKGFHLGPGSIKGHEFGLKLLSEDRAGSNRLPENLAIGVLLS